MIKSFNLFTSEFIMNGLFTNIINMNMEANINNKIY